MIRTCHWCHIMGEESFADEEVAAYLNQEYIAIKVDREERPDIDTVYMAVCQGLTGQGGWPLTIVMTPDKKPFFAGTYFPKRTKYQMPGLLEILPKLSDSWKTERDRVTMTAQKIVEAIQETNHVETQTEQAVAASSQDLRNLWKEAKELFAQNFDQRNGGFGTSPKFPTAHNLMFLLRYGVYEQDEDAISMVKKTLQQMYRGGIYDHLGYGFCRYSTDEKWLVPHFEKMLYDNALLAMIYTEYYQWSKNEFYKQVAEQILEYILREMTAEEGGFYSAQDADSDGVEGKYYVFTEQEVANVLGAKQAEEFNRFFDIRKIPNFEEGNIPNLLKNKDFKDTQEFIEQRQWQEACAKLCEYRRRRTDLHKDDKILTSWNALMIVAFAKAYGATQNERYLQAATHCYQFISEHLQNSGGRLFISYRQGKTTGTGLLDDYAYYIWALTMLYEMTADADYLEKALYFTKQMKTLFWDQEQGGFYLTAADGEQLIYRPKETYDGAFPSGNSVAGYALVKLKKLTGNEEIITLCDQHLAFLKQRLGDYIPGHSVALMALMMDDYEKGFLCENGVCS